MDVSMPEIERLRAGGDDPSASALPEDAIIFISAVHLSDLDRIKGYQSGAVDYISGPHGS